jgi:hypothetical protein
MLDNALREWGILDLSKRTSAPSRVDIYFRNASLLEHHTTPNKLIILFLLPWLEEVHVSFWDLPIHL